MTPIQHSACNDVLLAPPGDENCADLHIYRSDEIVASFWKPDEDELAALVRGGSVFMQVHGRTHPPLGLAVVPPEPAHLRPIVDAQEASLMHQFVNKQFLRLNELMKQSLVMLAKATPNNPDTTALYNAYLDMIGEKPE